VEYVQWTPEFAWTLTVAFKFLLGCLISCAENGGWGRHFGMKCLRMFKRYLPQQRVIAFSGDGEDNFEA